MSDSSQGPGWWRASDGQWYPPQEQVDPSPPVAATAPDDPLAPDGGTTATSPSTGKAPGGFVRGALLGVGAIAVVVILVAGFLAVQAVRSRIPDNAIPLGVDEPPSADLTLGDNAVVVSSSGGQAVRSISPDGRRIVIDAGAAGADKLQPGKTMVLTGVTAVEAEKVERQGDDIVVTAAPTALTDVIRDGKLKIDNQTADLSKAVLRVFPPTPDLVKEGAAGPLAPANGPSPGPAGPGTPTPSGADRAGEVFDAAPHLPVAAGSGESAAGYVDLPLAQAGGESVSRSGTLGGYEYRFDARISGGTITFTLHLSKDTNGVVIGVDVDAEVSGISFDGDIEISASSVRQFRLDAPNLAGRATITGSASASSQATRIPVTAMQIPMSIQVPFPIAGIPFTVGIEAEAKVELAFSSRDSHVTGNFVARFDGRGGMAVNDGSLNATGGFNIDWENPLEAVAGLSITPAALLVTIQFPKISLGLGIALARASAYFEAVFAFAPSVSGATNITPCIAAPVSMSVKAGITAEFLGHEITLAEPEISNRNAAPFEPQTRVCQI